jgi:uncharacterized membrane-anchored protein
LICRARRRPVKFHLLAALKTIVALVLLLTVTLSCQISAQDQKRQLTEKEKEEILDGLQWQTGSIAVGDGRATISLAHEYRFLNAADTRRVLTDLWRNRPSPDLGMIFPNGATPRSMSWAAIVERFEEEGYVKDDDADKLDPDKLLKDMQESQKEANADSIKQGYAELELVGWAMRPRYDKETKKLTWATDLRNVGTDHHSINYYVRILGRRGYLVLNLLGNDDALPEMERGLPELLSMVNFNEGHRYADFNPKTDKVAAYGIAGLIAAGIGLKLLKVGVFALFFKKIGLFLAAGWKLIAAGCAIVASWFKKLFGRKDTTPKPQQDAGA